MTLQEIENLEYSVASSFRDLCRLTSYEFALKVATSLLQPEERAPSQGVETKKGE